MFFRLLLLSAFTSIYVYSAGQYQNYSEIFGEKYVKAEDFIVENRITFTKYFPDTSEFQLVSSVVFPEIIRFNVLSNKIEVGALKTLYVQYGDQYANFSIGPFQMKPTFAEQLEKDYYKLNIKFDGNISEFFDTTSTSKARKIRVERLSTLEGQIMYLSLFCKIAKNRFQKLKFKTPVDCVRFLAAAYNSGFNNSIETIESREKEKHFHTDLIYSSKSQRYSYSDISAFYYVQLKSTIK
jgi:hypothetical protein